MRISKFLFAIFGLYLVSTSLNSATGQTNKAPEKLSLWTAKGKSNTVHFLGSIHYLKREFYPLPAPIEKAYTNAQIVVFETDMDRMKQPAILEKIMAEGTYPAGKSIADEISEEIYQLLRSTLSEKIGQPAALDRFKPYLVAVTLGSLELQRLGFQPEDGVDQYFMAKAKQDKKKVLTLETIEEQMGFFTGMNKVEQEAFLKSSLTDMNQIEKMFGEIIAAWEKGDSQKLEGLIMDSMKEYPNLIKKFLTDRNKNWIPEFEKLLQGDKDAFVIVGAAHLVGSGSVIELLKAKGIKVEQQSAR
ncbi:MAG: TraB/GumN family protein [Verrucomicrobia bacterium]|nr:TraB/GumN family protein [Verrucomicrobiota bacterium]